MHHQTVFRRTNRRLALGLAAAALTLAAALALAACDGDDDGGEDVSSTPPGAEATQPATFQSATATAEAERPTGFLGQHGVYATFAPADLDLYRTLLPEQFDMPENPLVLVFVADYYDINIPLSEMYPDGGLADMVPYLEGAAALQVSYNGKTGWHVITMPVDDQTANDAGRAIGFPKYVADEIALEETADGWAGEVVHEGRSVMRVVFTAAPDATVQESVSDGGGGVALYQLVPPAEGPDVNRVDSVSSGGSKTETLAGTVTITVDPGEEWAGLVPGQAVGAVFRETTGASNLVSSTPD